MNVLVTILAWVVGFLIAAPIAMLKVQEDGTPPWKAALCAVGWPILVGYLIALVLTA